jgi:hypothetical protein
MNLEILNGNTLNSPSKSTSLVNNNSGDEAYKKVTGSDSSRDPNRRGFDFRGRILDDVLFKLTEEDYRRAERSLERNQTNDEVEREIDLIEVKLK